MHHQPRHGQLLLDVRDQGCRQRTTAKGQRVRDKALRAADNNARTNRANRRHLAVVESSDVLRRFLKTSNHNRMPYE